MAYTKYRSKIWTEKGSGYTFRVSLIRNTGTGSPAEFEMSGLDHTKVQWEPDGAFGDDEYGCAFWLASAEIQIQDPSYTISDDIFSVGEGGFDMLIERDTSANTTHAAFDGSADVYVRLRVKPQDLAKTTDEYGEVSVITATDPLADLEGYNADDLFTMSGTATPVDFILEALDNVAQWDYDLRVAMYWYPGGSMASTVNPLDEIVFNKDVFDVTEDGEHWDMATVIRHLIGPFQCRMFQYGGYWHILQYEVQANSGSYREFVYDHNHYNVPSVSYSTVSRSKSLTSTPHLFRARGGSEIGTPAWVEARATYAHGLISGDLITNRSFEDGSGSTITGWSASGITIGTQDTSGGDARRSSSAHASGLWSLEMDAVANGLADAATNSQDVEDIFTNTARGSLTQGVDIVASNADGYYVRIGLNAAQKDGSEPCYMFVGVQYGSDYLQPDGTWSATTNYAFAFKPDVAYNLGFNRKVFSTSALPGSSSDTLTIHLWQPIVARSGASESGLGVYIDDVTLEYVAGEEENEAVTYAVSLSGTSNRHRRDGAAFKLGDGPTGTHPTTWLYSGAKTDNWEVWDGANATGTGGSDTARGLLYKYCERALLGRANYPMRHEASYRAGTGLYPIEPIDVPLIGSTYYGLHRVSRSLHEGISEVEMMEFDIASTSVSEEAIPDSPTAGGVSPSGGLGGTIISTADNVPSEYFSRLQVGKGPAISELVNLRNDDAAYLSGDVAIRFDSGIGGGGTWIMGVDTDDSNRFKITEGTSLGDGTAALGDRVIIHEDGHFMLPDKNTTVDQQFIFGHDGDAGGNAWTSARFEMYTNDPSIFMGMTSGNPAKISGWRSTASANVPLLQLNGEWSSSASSTNVVAQILLETGSDTANRDDGRITFKVASAGTANEVAQFNHDTIDFAKPLALDKTASTPGGEGGTVTLWANNSGDLQFRADTGTVYTVATTGGAGSTALGDLSDVTITAAATGDILRYNGSAWVDYPDSNFQSQSDVLDDLASLGASTADGQFLVATGAGALAWESGATARTSIGLGNVENTALSTWAGSTNLTTLGTVTTGTISLATSATFGSSVSLSVAGSDTWVKFTQSASGSTYSIGLDDSDSDAWKISESATLGTNDRFRVDATGNINIPGSLRVGSATATWAATLVVSGTLSVTGDTGLATVTAGTWQGTAVGVAYGGTGATTASGARTNLGLGTAATAASTDFLSATSSDVLSAAGAGSDLQVLKVENTSTVTGSGAHLMIQCAGTGGTGDAYLELSNSTSGFALGIDGSDGDAFVISESTAPGTNNRLYINSSGDLRIPGSMRIGTNANPSYNLHVTGTSFLDGNTIVAGSGDTLGFFGDTGATKPSVSGNASSYGALSSLCNALENLGLITNNTT